MRARCGDGRDVSSNAVGRGSGNDRGIRLPVRGVVDVGALSMYVVIKFGTEAGVTFSMIVKAGRRRTVVGSE
jgi:hypothetical protein